MKKATEETVKITNELIGKASQVIYADRLMSTYGSSAVEASRFVLPISDSMSIEVGSKWHYCEERALDYPIINLKVIEISSEKFSSLFSFSNKSPILKCNLVSYCHEEDTSFVFEAGILLKREDGKRILIHGGESAFRNVVLEQNSNKIDSMLEQISPL